MQWEETGNPSFLDPLVEALPNAREDNLPAIINALGNLQQAKAATALYSFLDHANPGIRLQTVIALGRIADQSSLEVLRKSLYDREPNVRWDAAVALAKMGDNTEREVLLNLLDENYLEDFKEVDPSERNQAMLVAIKVAEMLNDPLLYEAIEKLSKTAGNMEVRKAALQLLAMRTGEYDTIIADAYLSILWQKIMDKKLNKNAEEKKNPTEENPSTTAKPAQSVPKASIGKERTGKEVNISRRSAFSWLGIAWVAFSGATLSFLTMIVRFMYPNVLFEPPLTFKVGYADDYTIGSG